MIIDAIGIDAAFANMGFARVKISVDSSHTQPIITCLDLTLVQTEAGGTHKVVRKSSTELRRAVELRNALVNYAQGAQFAFVEVPSGSQSASAARSLGIAVGVLASCPIPIIEVSPMEVKIAVTGNRKIKADKSQVMAWAEARWPEAPWLRAAHKAKSKNGILPAGRLLADNEHCADALATIVAGIATPEFQRLIQLGTNHEISSTNNQRLAPSQRRVRLL